MSNGNQIAETRMALTNAVLTAIEIEKINGPKGKEIEETNRVMDLADAAPKSVKLRSTVRQQAHSWC